MLIILLHFEMENLIENYWEDTIEFYKLQEMVSTKNNAPGNDNGDIGYMFALTCSRCNTRREMRFLKVISQECQLQRDGLGIVMCACDRGKIKDIFFLNCQV